MILITRLCIFSLSLFFVSACTPPDQVSKVQRSDMPDESANMFTRRFVIEDFQKPIEAAAASDIRMQELTTDNVKELIKLSDYTWIAVWASWCPHCQSGIKEYYKTAEHFSAKGLRYVMVAEDYNLAAIQRSIFESGYRKQAYVLDPKHFGHDEAIKVTKLRNEICPACVDKDAVVPQHYIFNRFGKQILYSVGGDVDRQTIERALWVAQGMKEQ